MTGTFLSTMAWTISAPGGTAGLTTAKLKFRFGGLETPSATSTPRGRKTFAPLRRSGVSSLSMPTTRAPLRRRSAHAALPRPPRPITKTSLSCKSSIGSADLERAERNDRAQNSEDIKTHDDLGFIPALLFEMVMKRRH